jgi:hypothetical protein
MTVDYLGSQAIRLSNKWKDSKSFLIFDEIDESIGIKKLENFMTKFYTLVSPTFDDYVSSNRPTKTNLYI